MIRIRAVHKPEAALRAPMVDTAKASNTLGTVQATLHEL